MTGLLSNQGEKSINFYFIMVPFRKGIKVWYSKAQMKFMSTFIGLVSSCNASYLTTKPYWLSPLIL